ncbi:CHASE3 domain-containing protein [Flavivirga sp. 57AJ16]|uniref:CHASE3 domain-containing protein n=1 Tax=Flavivirga sp. 57AJ16 TaxID=3025307 RepID=UPI0023652A12|nr:CHASE3 domain-containing protein [Flavivirga sp. 57AJ16]MDD7886620.1 CHASE3 domain-containing protein [Flavivirga sp. 57AJ16]
MPYRLHKKLWFVKTVVYVCAFVILLVGGMTYKNIQSLSQASNLVTHTYKINVELEQVLSYLKDAETAQRGSIITNDPLYLEPYYSGRDSINNSFAELRELLKNNPTQLNNLKELNKLIDVRIACFQKSFRFSAVSDLGNPVFKENFWAGKQAMDAVRDKVKHMIALENKLLEEQQSELKENLKVTPIFLYMVLLMCLLLMYGAYAKIISNLKKLKKSNIELEMFKESANLSEIVSNYGNWVWNIDENTYIYSDNLYRLLGEEPNAFHPSIENLLKFVHPKDIKKLNKDIKKMMENENLPYTYFRIVQKNGKIRHLKSFAKKVINTDGKKQLIGTTSDVTEEVKSFRLLEEHNLTLERNNKELSAFNYVASHDLQEPLRKIQTFLSRLEEKEAENLSEPGLKYVDRIKTSATRMRLLIDDLLQFSRTNKADKVFEKSNLNLLLEGAKQDLAEAISNEKAIINANEFPIVKVIPFQIQQLFANLIGNSIKYRSLERTPEITITYSKVKASEESNIKKGKKDNYHKITFIDNGIGFDNAYAKKIFVLFNRLHNKDEYSGTGIGLSICKKIIENHKGFIIAKGKPGIGAKFTIYLPAKL